MNLTILKNSFFLILIAALGIAMTIFGIYIVVENNKRDLGDVKKISGIVEFATIVTKSNKVGVRPFIYIDQDYLGFKLVSNDLLFSTYNPKQSYESLRHQITDGHEITIYYKDYFKESPTNNVFQIESQGKVLLSHIEYKTNHSIFGFAIIAFGLCFVSIEIWLLRTRKIDEDWTKKY